MGMEARVTQPTVRIIAAAIAMCTAAGLLGAAAPPPQDDLNAFMEKVVAKRDDNWKKFQQYVLDEREQIEVRGPGKVPLWGERREYTWYQRDGFFVRSPVRFNGVTVSESDRRKYETEFLKREQDRDKRRKNAGEAPADRGAAVEADEVPTDTQGLILQSREPQFISSAYFLKFKFEKGKYAFVGRETVDGRALYKVEYYPERLFSHEQDSRAKRREKGEKLKGDNYDAAMEQMLNKVSVVTLWIEPEAHQIVKYQFDNVNVDFLPAAWLVRLTDLKAEMTMHMPFPDVWLPKEVWWGFSAMLAIGEIDAKYRLAYDNYKLAMTSARIK